ncbi:G8 domain-containing protein, partial [Planoprotostelium fungivorum]
MLLLYICTKKGTHLYSYKKEEALNCQYRIAEHSRIGATKDPVVTATCQLSFKAQIFILKQDSMRACGALFVVLLLAFADGACLDTSSYSLWSNVYGNLAVNASVNIAANSKILFDASPSVALGYITVGGILAIKDTTLDINIRGLLVKAGGLLVAGTADCPITSKVTITLYGNKGDPTSMGTDPYDGVIFGDKSIWTATNGSIQLYGWKSGPSWTRISATAKVNDTSISLVEAVTWKVGDVFFITSTDFHRTISAVTNGGKTISFSQGLTYQHYGVVPMNAEVGLLTRWIVIRGDNSSINSMYGGHLGMRNSNKNGGTVLSGVELTQMGQAGILGRYPVHFHMMRYVYNMGVSATDLSIHHNYQRCISIHETHGAVVQNCVCFDTYGHAMFLEDGGERGNVWDHNLASVVRPQLKVYKLLDSDDDPSVFWITNPNNTWTNNVATGSNTGYWFFVGTRVNSPSYDLYYQDDPTAVVPMYAPKGVFVGNSGHTLGSWTLDISRMNNAPAWFPKAGPPFTSASAPLINDWDLQMVCYKVGGCVWTSSAGRWSNVWMSDIRASGVLGIPNQLFVNFTIIGESANIGAAGRFTGYSCGVDNYDVGGNTIISNVSF